MHSREARAAPFVAGWKGQSSDVCVPISRLAECIEATKKDIEEHGMIATFASP